MQFTPSKIYFFIFLNIIFILLLLGFTFYNLFSLEEIQYPSEKYISSDLEMYFLPTDLSLKRLFNTIELANNSISCVFRSLNYPKLEDLLFSKEQESGVRVRIFVDSDYMGNKRIYTPFVRFSDPDLPMMHANYCIVDESIVITGSTIFNENTLHLNFHDLIFINSSELASEFNKHFWYLYNNQTREHGFGENRISIGEHYVTPLFCPLDACEEKYVEVIDSAQDTVYFAIYAFTNPEIISAVKRAEERGVEIKGVVERQGLTPSSIAFEEIYGVVIDKFNRRIHTKLLVVDGETIITGSLNPSIRGVNQNDESILVIESSNLARVYEEYIPYVYNYKRRNF